MAKHIRDPATVYSHDVVHTKLIRKCCHLLVAPCTFLKQTNLLQNVFLLISFWGILICLALTTHMMEFPSPGEGLQLQPKRFCFGGRDLSGPQSSSLLSKARSHEASYSKMLFHKLGVWRWGFKAHNFWSQLKMLLLSPWSWL